MKKQKLTQTGQWIWREDEISYKSFTLLSKEKKLEHLEYLMSIGRENLSTNDWYILKNYGPVNFFNEKSKPFWTLEEAAAIIQEQNILQDIGEYPTVNEITSLGMEYVQEYLNALFENKYPDWETNMKFHSLEKFVASTNNIIYIDKLSYVHICAYYKLK